MCKTIRLALEIARVAKLQQQQRNTGDGRRDLRRITGEYHQHETEQSALHDVA